MTSKNRNRQILWDGVLLWLGRRGCGRLEALVV